MKLVLFDDQKPGLVKGDPSTGSATVVDITEQTRRVAGHNAQETMAGIIENFAALRPELERALNSSPGVPLSSVRLRAPLPRPGKIMMMGANFREFTPNRLPIWGFLKSPEAVLDPGGTIVLPKYQFPVCHHEAELVVVIGKTAKDVSQANAMDHVFGYMNGIDVSVRMDMMQNSLIGKSADTFAPMGPWIVTKDEIPDPHKLQVRLSVDGQLRHDYNMSDIGHPIEECIEYYSERMTMKPGDVLSLGTNHAGLGALQDGDNVDMEIEKLGHLQLKVSDPLKRSWPKKADPDFAHNRLREQLMAQKPE